VVEDAGTGGKYGARQIQNAGVVMLSCVASRKPTPTFSMS